MFFLNERNREMSVSDRIELSKGPVPNLDRRTVLEASEEAKNKPTLFEPKPRATYVDSEVRKIRALVMLHKTDSEIRKEVPEFAKAYPTLFEYALKPNFDYQNLKIMLGLLNRMGDNKMSQHQASVVVGQHMADRYIKPSVENETT
jgi:hypothetical protein